MNRIKTVSFGLRRNVLLVAGAFLSLYFSYHMFYGVRSFSSLEQLDNVVAMKQESLDSIRVEREDLEVHVKKMRPDSLSLDMLEEQVRLILAYKKPDEVFVVGN